MTYPLPEGIALPIERRLGACSVPLLSPVRHGDQKLEAIEFRACTGAHVRRMPDAWNDNGKLLAIAAQLTQLPDSVLDQLSGADLGDVLKTATRVAWPAVDLPAAWEIVWQHHFDENLARGEPTERLELPRVRAPFVLELSRPYQAGERDSVASLTFGEVTGKMVRTLPLDGIGIAELPRLVEQLAGVPRELVDRLEGVDLNRALAVAQLFFLATRGTGASSARSSPGNSGGRPTSSIDSRGPSS